MKQRSMRKEGDHTCRRAWLVALVASVLLALAIGAQHGVQDGGLAWGLGLVVFSVIVGVICGLYRLGEVLWVWRRRRMGGTVAALAHALQGPPPRPSAQRLMPSALVGLHDALLRLAGLGWTSQFDSVLQGLGALLVTGALLIWSPSTGVLWLDALGVVVLTLLGAIPAAWALKVGFWWVVMPLAAIALGMLRLWVWALGGQWPMETPGQRWLRETLEARDARLQAEQMALQTLRMDGVAGEARAPAPCTSSTPGWTALALALLLGYALGVGAGEGE